MKKALYVLLGVVLIASAVGFFAYRQTPEGKLRIHEFGRSTEHRRSVLADRREAPGQPSTSSRELRRGPASEAPAPESDSSGLKFFELAVNVLNVGVGLIGIWLAFVGTRMQRQAIAMRPARDE